jgi:hypothetical protein
MTIVAKSAVTLAPLCRSSLLSALAQAKSLNLSQISDFKKWFACLLWLVIRLTDWLHHSCNLDHPEWESRLWDSHIWTCALHNNLARYGKNRTSIERHLVPVFIYKIDKHHFTIKWNAERRISCHCACRSHLTHNKSMPSGKKPQPARIYWCLEAQGWIGIADSISRLSCRLLQS